MEKRPEVRYDAEADVLYLVAKEGPIGRSDETAPGLTLEFDSEGKTIGIEILHASRVLSRQIVSALGRNQAEVT